MTTVCIFSDGGSRGNPGIAGSGTLLYNEDRSEVLAKIAEYLGSCTNNVAEYHGLVNGLEAAASLGATEVQVYMDSKLVVEQMRGKWKIKHPDMQKLAMQAQRIARGFAAVSYNWVPRNENKAADELANMAMDAGADGAEPGKLDLGFGAQGARAATGTGASAPGASDAASAGAAVGTTAASASPATSNESTAPSPGNWHGATTQATRLILLRHGQTEMSVAGQYSGRRNPELTAFGKRQARAAARRLAAAQEGGKRYEPKLDGIAAVVSSPLARAQQTAEACAKALELDVVTHEGLLELDFGEWEGKTFAEAHNADPEFHAKWLADQSLPCPGGEAVADVFRRAESVQRDVEKRFPGQAVLLVSHVTPIKSLVCQALGLGVEGVNATHLDLASLSVVERYADGPQLLRLFNDGSHLAGM